MPQDFLTRVLRDDIITLISGKDVGLCRMFIGE